MKKLLSILGAMTLIGTATTSVIACGGENPSSKQKIDISNKIPDVLNLGKLSENTVNAVQEKLQAQLEKIPGLEQITDHDFFFDLVNTGNNVSDDDVIKNTSLSIKILTYNYSNKFKGDKERVTINYMHKDTRTDIGSKITSPIVLGQLSANTAQDFLSKLQTALSQITGLNTITANDYDVYKAGTGTVAIQDSDIIEDTSLDIKIVASSTSQNFRGSNQNIVVNFQKKLDSILTDTDLGTINIPQSIIDDIDKSKIEWLILSYLKSNNKNKNLKTLGIDVSNVQINKKQNTGTAKIKSNNQNDYTGEVNISFVVSREKVNLNQLVIDQYSDTNADTSKTMKDLDISKILEIFNKIKLINPIIEYQDLKGKNINKNVQKAGTFQVKITAGKSDPNYKGVIVDSGWVLK